MKKLLVLLSYALIVLAFAGCQSLLVNRDQKKVFPEVMVGVWQAEVSPYSKWGIKFEPDGSIRKIIHSAAGPVNLEEGGVYAQSDTEDAYYYFVMGPCEATYIPEARILKVKIVVEHFTMKLPQGVLEGRSEDYFEGLVSEDGKSWATDWRSYGWLEGGDPVVRLWRRPA